MTTNQQDVPVRVGDVLADKYRVEKVLGAGAMGVVVAARHVELGELWAIKFMLPAALGNHEGVERFLREARAAARLRSRHVAKVSDVGRLPTGAPYLVMEHLTGTDLKQLLEQRGVLPPPEAVTYVLQACEALAEAHAAGIVHRDLKPANLFLTTEVNGAPCVKLLDFGIAKMPAGAASPGMDMTATSALLGTPLYMSPEQMRGARDVDARADIWALGVILYRMLAGKTPFSGSSVTEICSAVVADTPAPLAQVRGDLPPGLDAIVGRCLEKNPAQRFQSVPELAAALGPFAQPGAGGHARASVPMGMAPQGYGPASASYAGQAAAPGAGTYGPGSASHPGQAGGYNAAPVPQPGAGTFGPGNASYAGQAGGYNAAPAPQPGAGTFGPGNASYAGQPAAPGAGTFGPGNASHAGQAGGYNAAPAPQPGAGTFAQAQSPVGYGAAPQAPMSPQVQATLGPGASMGGQQAAYGGGAGPGAQPGFGPAQAVSMQPPGAAVASPAPAQKGSRLPLILGSVLAVIGLGGIAAAAVVMSSSGSSSGSDARAAGAGTGAPAMTYDPRSAPGATSASGTAAAPSASSSKGAQPTSAGGGAKPGAQPPSALAPSAQPSTSQAPAAAGNLPLGASCTSGSECGSGFCADRVCCDSACNARCMACTPQKKFSGGGPGSCGWISGGEDPDHECGAGKKCDGDGGCVTLTPTQVKNLTGHN